MRKRDRQLRKKKERDRRQRERRVSRVAPAITKIRSTQRIAERFTLDELQMFVERSWNWLQQQLKHDPRKKSVLSEYRTLYGNIVVAAGVDGKVFVMYRDELPTDAVAHYPTFGQRQYKYTDAEWNEYVKLIWQLTGGDRDMIQGTFEPDPNRIAIEPFGKGQVKISGPADEIAELKKDLELEDDK